MDRRKFIEQAIGVAGLATVGTTPAFPAPKAAIRKATDLVALGKTGIRVSRIGFGTGTIGGMKSSNQVRAGQATFTKNVRHFLDMGLNYLDSADSYGSMPFYKEALKGVPRDKYVIQSKVGGNDGAQAAKDIERFLTELGVDCIDIVLSHCATTADWAEKRAGVREALAKAKEKGMIRTYGISWHGMAPLRTMADDPWPEVVFVRINNKGSHMDSENPDEVVPHINRMHKNGKGVLGMKILGEGDIKEPADKDASLRFVLGLGTVHTMVIGIEKAEQVDDLIQRTDAALKELAGKERVRKAA